MLDFVVTTLYELKEQDNTCMNLPKQIVDSKHVIIIIKNLTIGKNFLWQGVYNKQYIYNITNNSITQNKRE